MAVSFDAKRGVVALEGEVNIECAAALKSALTAALDGAAPAAISLAGVTGVDVTAIQLLVAAERQARTAGRMLTADAWPESVGVPLREAGFSELPFAANAG